MKMFIVLSILAACKAFSGPRFELPGGWSFEQEADPRIQDMADEVRMFVEKRTGSNGFSNYRVVKYRVQTVAGYNYILKIDVGNNSYVHVRIFKTIEGTVFFQGVQTGKSFSDPIEVFY